MGVIIKKTVGRVRLSDGTMLNPGDKVSDAQLKSSKKLKDFTEEDKPKSK